MRKLLIITYYWPPDTGGGVQRILKFCKYLQAFGHELVVVTRAHAAHAEADPSFLAETRGIRVIRVPFRLDPLRAMGSGGHDRQPRPQAVKDDTWRKLKAYVQNLVWLNVFVPDAKIGWYRPVRKQLTSLLENETFDTLITTGPPYTVHLLGLFIKQRYGLPWIVDARDPWVENVYYNAAYRFPLVKLINRRLARRVLARADRVITVGTGMAALLGNKVDPRKIKVIYNGFDDVDFDISAVSETATFRLGYYGSLHKQQVPHVFLKALAAELKRDTAFARDFRFTLYGEADSAAKETFRNYLPARNLSFHPAVSHSALQGLYARPQVFLLLINNFACNELIITGKLFEYFYCGWPILGIGPPTGDAAGLLQKTGAGKMYTHQDAAAVDWLRKNYVSWTRRALARRPVLDPLFSRRSQARQLETIIETVSAGPASC